MPSVTALQTYEDALSFLDGLDVSSMKLGLERVRRVLATLGNPQDRLPMVHIAGTNGKGSVTAMLGSILKEAGYKTGTFTSPHLIHVRERISINGNPILPDDFLLETEALKSHLERLSWPRDEWPTYFEFLNVMAYRYFQRQDVDVAVFETGLGGRLDSTNVVKHPNLTVITSIGMDHMQHLGNTIELIAAEKAGILKNGTPLVLGAVPAGAEQVIRDRAAGLEVPVFPVQPEDYRVSEATSLSEGLAVEKRSTGQTFRLALLGPYQKDNLAVVLACVDQLRGQGFVISEEALQKGLMHARWPVRFQYFAAENILLDGSHNADGFSSLSDGLDLYFSNRPKAWLVSLRNNREPQALLDVIRQAGAPIAVIVTQAEPNRLYHAPETLAEMIRTAFAGSFNVQVAATPTEGLHLLREELRSHAASSPLGVVTGSLYTAGECLAVLERRGSAGQAPA